MIDRYCNKEIAFIWSRETCFNLWLTISRCGIQRFSLPSSEAVDDVVDGLFIGEVEKEELSTGHDVGAFLAVLARRMEAKLPGSTAYLHFGMTSSDLVDTANAVMMACSVAVVNNLIRGFNDALVEWSKGANVTAVGYTHGVPAQEINLASRLLRSALDSVKCGTLGHLSGPVGKIDPVNFAAIVNSDATISWMMRRFNLFPTLGYKTSNTQNEPRDVYARTVFDLALTAAKLEKLAIDFRLMVITGDIVKLTAKSEVGSSSMPHKANPVEFEKVCGLARFVRGSVTSALENVSLWLERDISHSSVERIILPTLFHVVAESISTMTKALSLWIPDKKSINASVEKYKEKLRSHERLMELQVSIGYLKAHEQLKGELR